MHGPALWGMSSEVMITASGLQNHITSRLTAAALARRVVGAAAKLASGAVAGGGCGACDCRELLRWALYGSPGGTVHHPARAYMIYADDKQP
jgi:hypothetical protein